MFDVFLINCIWDWFVEYFGFVELLVLFRVNCFDVIVINDWLCMQMILSVKYIYINKKKMKIL